MAAGIRPAHRLSPAVVGVVALLALCLALRGRLSATRARLRVVGDEDGLVCVPFAQAQEIQVKAAAKFKSESDTIAAIGRGDNNAALYRKKLLELECSFED